MKSRTFRLLGHDCTYGAYPAPVIPIGKLNGRLVAVYPGGNPGPTLEPLDDGRCEYVHHKDKALRARLAGFDYTAHRLFARTENNVVYYPVAQERQFFQDFLNRPEYADANPVLRRLLAEHVNALAEPEGQPVLVG